MSRALAVASACLLLLGAARDALAGPCASEQPEAGVPARIPLGPAELGSLAEACPRNELSLRGFASVLIAEQDFYGMLHAGVALHARLRLPGSAWLSFQLPGIEHRFVANATIEAESTDVGAGSLGFHQGLPVGERLQIAPFVRLLAPTETVYEHATRFGFDHGIAGVWRLEPQLELAGSLSFPTLLTLNHGSLHVVHVPTVGVDAVLAPWRFLAVVLGAALRVRAGSDEPLESIDPRVATRLYFASGGVAEIAAAFPISGADRTDVILAASVGWIW
jgi:hypothetical protein